MRGFVKQLGPQERDRMLQVYLAQARGRQKNGDVLRQAVDRTLRILALRAADQREMPMNDALVESLTEVASALEAVGATYAVTGSIATSVHGEPIPSYDVDLIVSASMAQAARLADCLRPRFYAEPEMLRDAAANHDFVNVIDQKTSLKVDLSFVRGAYLGNALSRRVRSRIGGAEPEFWFVTPEDAILMKLLWRKDSRSAKQWDNALSVVRVRGARLDWKYLFEQARELDIEDDLAQLRDEGGV